MSVPKLLKRKASLDVEPASLLPRTLLPKTLHLEDARSDRVAKEGSGALEDDAPPRLPERYQDMGPIAKGAMGEVRRARDTLLDRIVALKILHPHLKGDAQLRARFLDEARGTARLQHPGIVAVHDLGELEDGRVFFAMREVEGQTLTEVIQGAHGGRDGALDPLILRRLIRILIKAAEALAYAHALGVVHRDLKPDNIMVGPFGEVLILDWGLARFINALDASGGTGPHSGGFSGGNLTEFGQVLGTPAYMSPAQARGEEVGTEADVYALGAILYELLTGAPPFAGPHPMVILGAVLRGERRPWGPSAIPSTLIAICDRAMGLLPGRDIGTAQTALADLQDWLDGATRRAAALAYITEADALWEELGALRRDARAHRAEAHGILKDLARHSPVEAKAGAWELEEQATRLERDAYLKELAYTQGLHGALAKYPKLPEALARLADYYHLKHKEAEARGDEEEGLRLLALLRGFDQGRYQAYLEGQGRLSLHSDPPGAQVSLMALQHQQRRLVPKLLRDLGPTPIDDLTIPMGRYLLRITHGEGEPLDYPIRIEREGRWNGAPTGQDAPYIIPIPPKGVAREGEVIIPPGPFFSGGDPDAYNGLPGREIWVDGFIIQRFPVTQGDYYAFLNDLVDQGREEEALTYAPRDRGGLPGEGKFEMFTRDDAGYFHRAPDGEGRLYPLDWPMVIIDWHCARAYGAWLSEGEGLPWRLPWELEWEKAARGADRRIYPWGDGYDPALCNVHGSQEGVREPCGVSQFPSDRSPYGVQGMGGNVQDWCLDAFHQEGPVVGEDGYFDPSAQPPPESSDARTVRGGAYSFHEKGSRVCLRPSFQPHIRGSILGFRLVRPISL